MRILPSTTSTTASSAQIAANQANSKRSTGPKTEAGKQASSANRTTHGLTGSFILLADEDEQEYTDLLDRLTAEHRPMTDTESLLVMKVAQSHWLIQRALSFQSGAMNQETLKGMDKQLSLFMRYQSQQERVFNKSLAQLKELQKERRDKQHGVYESKVAEQCYKNDAAEARADILKIKAAEAMDREAERQAAKAAHPEIGFESQNGAQAALDRRQPTAA